MDDMNAGCNFTYSKNILNVVVVGQSGVGKSSFLNYMADKDVFRTGVGGAVTKGYFEKFETRRGKVTYALYDTEGLEPGKVNQWESVILSEIRKRDESNDMSDWFHSILFCISAESKRIQPFEVDAIRRMTSTGHVIVLLTKMDKVSPDEVVALKEELVRQLGDQIDVIPVCSVSQKFRNGKRSVREGLQDVLQTTFIGLWKKMAKKVPVPILSNVRNYKAAISYPQTVTGLISWNILNGFASKVEHVMSFGALCKTLGLAQNDISYNTDIDSREFKKVNVFNSYVAEWSGNKIIVTGRFPYQSVLKLPVTPSKDILDWGIFRKGLNNYLIDWNLIYNNLIKELNSLEIESICQSIKSTITICKDLYLEVTGLNLRKQVFLHDILAALKELKAHGKSQSDIQSLYARVREAIKEIDGCTFFNGSERDRLIKIYGVFKAAADSYLAEYIRLMAAVVSSIQQELRSFADYTLRETDGDSHPKSINIEPKDFMEFIKLLRGHFHSLEEWNNFIREVYEYEGFDDSIKNMVVEYGNQ